MSDTSPYRRDNYYGKDASDERPGPAQPAPTAGTPETTPSSADGVGDGPETNPGPAGVWKPDPNDPAAHVAHQTLKECGDVLCRATLEAPPYNGGRLGELFAWLFADSADDLIDGAAWALHAENARVPLSDPCCYPPAETAGEHRHRRRVNPETGYLNWGETTSAYIPDRPTEDFMAAVELWLARRDGTLRTEERERALAYARRLKKQGEKRDQAILRLVIKKTREQDLPE